MALLLVIGATGVLASHNRSAIGAVVVGIAAHAVSSRSSKRLLGASIGVALIGVLLVFVDVGEAIARKTSETTVSFWSDGEAGAFTGRTEVWQSAIDHGIESPMTGQGNGSFKDLSAVEFERLRQRWDPTHPHNVILEVFVDQGLVGLAILAAVLAAALRSRKMLPIGGSVFLAAIGFHSLVESVFHASPSPRWQFLVLVLAGIPIQAQNLEQADHGGDRDAQGVDDEGPVGTPS
jgi:O-antigen ligase